MGAERAGSGALRAVACAVAGALALLVLTHQLVDAPLRLVEGDHVGQDYACYHGGAQQLAAGRDPYSVACYVTPPLAAQLLAPTLAPLPFEHARWWIVGLSSAAVALSLLICCWLFAERPLVAWSEALLAIACGFPLAFLLYRGNADAFVLLACVVGLALLGERDLWAGAAIGVGAALKLYPLLLALPLLLQRRWWALAGGALVMAAAAGSDWTNSQRFLQRMAVRGGAWHALENGSLAAACFWIERALGAAAARPRLAGELLFASLIAAAAWRTRTPTDDPAALRRALALWMPFCVAVPALAFAYELVMLAPLLALLASGWATRAPRLAVAALGVGLALSQLHGVALARLLAWSQGVADHALEPGEHLYQLPHAVPAWGLLLTLLAAVALLPAALRGGVAPDEGLAASS